MVSLSTWFHKLRIWSFPWFFSHTSAQPWSSQSLLLILSVYFSLIQRYNWALIISSMDWTTYTRMGLLALGLILPPINFFILSQTWCSSKANLITSLKSHSGSPLPTQYKNQNSITRHTKLSRIWPMVTFSASSPTTSHIYPKFNDPTILTLGTTHILLCFSVFVILDFLVTLRHPFLPFKPQHKCHYFLWNFPHLPLWHSHPAPTLLTGAVKHFLFGALLSLVHMLLLVLLDGLKCWVHLLSQCPWGSSVFCPEAKGTKTLDKIRQQLDILGQNNTVADPCLPLFWWYYQAVSGRNVCAWCLREQHPIPKTVV